MIGATAVFVGALFAYGYFRWHRRRIYELAREVPDIGPSLPFIGHAHYFIGGDKAIFEILQKLAKTVNENQGVVKMWLAHKLVYAVTDPEDVCTILNECLGRTRPFNFFRRLFGNGLITSCESVWKYRVKKLLPSFSQKVLNRFISTFNEQSSVMAMKMSREAGRGWFDPQYYIGAATLENICQTAMCTSMGHQDLPDSSYLTVLPVLAKIYTERVLKIWLHPDFIYRLFGYEKTEIDAVKSVNNLTNKIIQTRKSYFEKNCDSEMEIEVEKDKPTMRFVPFLDLLLKLNKDGVFTDEIVRDEVNTLVAAGQETTAYTAHFVLLMLGSHQDKQEKAYEEIQLVFGSNDIHVTKEDLRKLVYLEAIINETLRLYPTVAVIVRRVDREVKLKNYTLAKGADAAVLTWGIHRHKRWGVDYNSFRPERWFDPACVSEIPGAFCPFSIGKRTCIGKNYAMMSIKTMLVHILRNYRVNSDIQNLTCKINILLSPKTGNLIRLEKRV